MSAVVESELVAEVGGSLWVLLVEDDDGDAVLFEELLVSAGVVVQLTRARSLEDAVLRWCPEMDAVALRIPPKHGHLRCGVSDLGLTGRGGSRR